MGNFVNWLSSIVALKWINKKGAESMGQIDIVMATPMMEWGTV